MEDEQLLNSFRQIWNSRKLDLQMPPKAALEEAVRRDLLDEGTHPRVRKNPDQKYTLAVSRVRQSHLNDEEKNKLIALYEKTLASLKK